MNLRIKTYPTTMKSLRIYFYCAVSILLLACENISVEDIANAVIVGNKINAETYDDLKLPVDILRKLDGSDDFSALGLKLTERKSENGEMQLWSLTLAGVDECSDRNRLLTRLSRQPNINIRLKSVPSVEVSEGQEYYHITNSNKPVGIAEAIDTEDGTRVLTYAFPLKVKYKNYQDSWMINPATNAESHILNFLNFIRTEETGPYFPRVGRLSSYHSKFCTNCQVGPDSYYVAFRQKNTCGTSFEAPSFSKVKEFYSSLENYSVKETSKDQIDIYYNESYIGLAIKNSLSDYHGPGYENISVHFFRETPTI